MVICAREGSRGGDGAVGTVGTAGGGSTGSHREPLMEAVNNGETVSVPASPHVEVEK